MTHIAGCRYCQSTTAKEVGRGLRLEIDRSYDIPVIFTSTHRTPDDALERRMRRVLEDLFIHKGGFKGAATKRPWNDGYITDFAFTHASMFFSPDVASPFVGPLDVPQALADEMALIAQRYFGYFWGRQLRYTGAGKVEDVGIWERPLIAPDGCALCKELTDDQVRTRIAGYQYGIDKEVARICGAFATFPPKGMPGDPEWEEAMTNIVQASGGKILRKSLLELPPDLQFMMVIEWNHAIAKYPNAVRTKRAYEERTRVLKELKEFTEAL